MRNISDRKNTAKVIVVMPACNAEHTVEKTLHDLPTESFDEIILVDDCSGDRTSEVALALGITVIERKKGGYGASCDLSVGCFVPSCRVNVRLTL